MFSVDEQNKTVIILYLNLYNFVYLLVLLEVLQSDASELVDYVMLLAFNKQTVN